MATTQTTNQRHARGPASATPTTGPALPPEHPVPPWRQEMNEARKALLKAWVVCNNAHARATAGPPDETREERAAFVDALAEVHRLYALVRGYYVTHGGQAEPPYLLALVFDDLKTYAPDLLTRPGPTRAYLVKAGYLKP